MEDLRAGVRILDSGRADRSPPRAGHFQRVHAVLFRGSTVSRRRWSLDDLAQEFRNLESNDGCRESCPSTVSNVHWSAVSEHSPDSAAGSLSSLLGAFFP